MKWGYDWWSPVGVCDQPGISVKPSYLPHLLWSMSSRFQVERDQPAVSLNCVIR